MSISSSFRLLPPKIPILLQPKFSISKTLIQSTQFPSKFSSYFSISIQRLPTKLSSSSSSSSVSSASLQPIEDLPPKLQEIVKLFQTVQEPKAKYEQLLFYGRKLTPLDTQFKTNENKVQGCVSQVWVRAYLDSDKNVLFEADSDSVLTKGLAALLVQGLSGRPVSEILKVSPDFVTLLGLQQSLTPSRNNGFLNMLRLMQNKALQLYKEAEEGGSSVNNAAVDDGNQVRSEIGSRNSNFDAKAAGNDNEEVKSEDVEVASNLGVRLGSRGERIKEKLEKELNPIELEIEDISHQHAGHAGVRGNAGETHFNVRVVSKEFDGKSLVKRHRLVYDLLQGELQSGLHALSIVAKTPSEVNGR
ncbi:BolA protein [Macleaya cordata]|uniref:BolA protein n=1 Tax=Macleaya cordata TaxID=56857 RepID=A0A200RAI6_MACCD|nr:BolA protein [Macleaya cordata]